MALEAVGMQMLTFCVRMCAIFEGGEEVLGWDFPELSLSIKISVNEKEN